MTAASRTATLTARRAILVTQLAAANAAYTDGLSKLKQYAFESADGKQAATRRDLDELEKQISKLEAKIDAIDVRLNGGGIVGIEVSRW